MIRDRKMKLEIAQDWRGVRKLCKASHRQWMVPGSGMINEQRPEDSYNLPLVLAYGVLDHVLNELHDQRAFTCKRKKPGLGEKMGSSKLLPWQNYDLVDNGRVARNDLAHQATLSNKADCLRFIDAIESELKAWGVV